jgi:hypothetical protein
MLRPVKTIYEIMEIIYNAKMRDFEKWINPEDCSDEVCGKLMDSELRDENQDYNGWSNYFDRLEESNRDYDDEYDEYGDWNNTPARLVVLEPLPSFIIHGREYYKIIRLITDDYEIVKGKNLKKLHTEIFTFIEDNINDQQYRMMIFDKLVRSCGCPPSWKEIVETISRNTPFSSEYIKSTL